MLSDVVTFLTTHWVGWLFLAAVFLVASSFLNVAITRLPMMASDRDHKAMRSLLFLRVSAQSEVNLVRPRSFCPACLAPIRLTDNIPILSYCLLRGKCRCRQTSIPRRFLIVEIAGCAFFFLVFVQHELSFAFLCYAIFAGCLLVLIFTDIEQGVLPDTVTYTLIWIGLLYVAFQQTDPTMHSLQSAIGGAIVGYGLFWTLNAGFRWIRKREGMGYGDFKLAAALGVWLGLSLLPLALVFAAVLALAYGLVNLMRGQYSSREGIAFGPFLSLSGLLLGVSGIGPLVDQFVQTYIA